MTVHNLEARKPDHDKSEAKFRVCTMKCDKLIVHCHEVLLIEIDRFAIGILNNFPLSLRTHYYDWDEEYNTLGFMIRTECG